MIIGCYVLHLTCDHVEHKIEQMVPPYSYDEYDRGVNMEVTSGSRSTAMSHAIHVLGWKLKRGGRIYCPLHAERA